MKRFKKVYIEIGNICNLNCSFCPSTSRKQNFMQEGEFKQILQNIKPYTDHIYFHLLGEPLLHPNLKKFLELSGEFELNVNITTNGTLIKTNKDILLSSPALRQINYSLHSFEANDYPVSMEDYLNSILEFVIEAKEHTKIISSFRLWNLNSSSSKDETKLNSTIIKILESTFNLDYDLNSEITLKKSVKIAKRVYLNMAERFQWPNLQGDFLSDTGFCYGLRDQIGILVDGTVVPCCLDGEGSIPLGNVFSTSFSEIVENEKVKTIYNGFSNGKAIEPLCQKCGYRTRFIK
jgi:Predicted Fe-S oxidoreductases